MGLRDAKYRDFVGEESGLPLVPRDANAEEAETLRTYAHLADQLMRLREDSQSVEALRMLHESRRLYLELSRLEQP